MDPALAPTLRALGAALLAAFATRIELAAAELEGEAERTGRMLVLASIAAMCGFFVLALLTALVVAAFWDTARLWSLAVVALVYALSGTICVVRLQALRAAREPLLSATITELRSDRDALKRIGNPQGAP